MPKESPLPLPPAEESPAADTEPDAPEPELAEPVPEPIAEPSFICECKKGMRTACNGEPFYGEHEGKRYCVLHYPGKEKATEFESTFRKKVEAGDFNFYGIWFPQAVNFSRFEFIASADFRYATFSAEANFNSAKFSAEAYFSSAIFTTSASFDSTKFSASANFSSTKFIALAYFHSATFSAKTHFISAEFSAEANFSSATFSVKAYFSSALFSSLANFRYATFNAKAYFGSATFSARADFSSATFYAEVKFSPTTFNAEAKFREATFKDQVDFSGIQSFGDQAALDLQFARIEKPERVSFHTLSLRPHWFVNVDPRKLVFTGAIWDWKEISIKSEIQNLEAKNIPVDQMRRLLAIACRQLAENAEADNRYEEASRFRYLAMDSVRIEKWKGWTFWKTDWLHVLYWTVSGYGERMRRAFVWLVVIWIVFALLYTRIDFTKPDEPLSFKDTFIYSLGVMSLQKPEPKPLTGTAQTLVLLETILGPLQAALLALAIRRKFMR